MSACSVLYGSDGLADGRSDSSAPDASGLPANAEAGVTPDGAPGPPPVDGGTPCDGGHLFCDDFEHDSLTAQFSTLALNGGTMAIDTSASRSGTRSLRVSVVGTMGPATFGPTLEKTFTDAAGTITVSFWMRRDAYEADQQVSPFLLIGELADGRKEIISLLLAPDLAKIEYATVLSDSTRDYNAINGNAFAPPKGEWVHVQIVTRLSGSDPIVEAFANGTLIASAALTLALPLSALTKLTLSVGAETVQWGVDPTPWVLRIDDVVVDVEN